MWHHETLLWLSVASDCAGELLRDYCDVLRRIAAYCVLLDSGEHGEMGKQRAKASPTHFMQSVRMLASALVGERAGLPHAGGMMMVRSRGFATRTGCLGATGFSARGGHSGEAVMEGE
ncbi:hypothetical protein [Paraburkholderia sp. HD33-4]|uniref:hypothetical protein n=1 Tax=Paraburkholderia sp. HD33-4 TaxID=2883242 RepID=UPI001F266799|nr:hypothetical protein [Paraburkholderia sp. HD33-4]